ncbi:hypothetical protein K443DRAFT_11233 [Laccaria amethystina LaAM-08-1]|uniref:Unplaced genomic scaffold K443scaffold_213, whole genome shotgun sequence n=1 Tax=Laccaria amethystina LaAM-08-1 TaxID=1095629 RepID=A0A0C9WU35_9AGAR|nr:hypothetical protein K443DRAFT_11233 [Laccaria amethystina LaAM-08-1]
MSLLLPSLSLPPQTGTPTSQSAYLDLDARMFDIDNLQVRDYELEDELAARGFGPLPGLAPTLHESVGPAPSWNEGQTNYRRQGQ